MGITDALAAVLGGGATGLIGTAVTQFVAYKNRKADAAERVLERAHDLQTMQFEAAANAKVETIRADSAYAVAATAKDAAVAVAASEGIKASHASDGRKYASSGKSFLFVIVDFVRGMMRPTLTLVYTGLAIYILLILYRLVGDLNAAASPAEVFGLFKEVILLTLYMASATTLWWFGTRPPEKK